MSEPLPPIPYGAPIADPNSNNMVSKAWGDWFRAAFARMGGHIAQSNSEITAGAIVDHGALTGLGDDDHTHYHNNARGDARYYTQAQVDTAVAAKVSDTAYDATSWNGVTTVAPSKNAVRDQVETMVSAYSGLVSDTAFDATSWNGVTGVAPSKNAVRDEIVARFDASTGHDHDGTDGKKIPVGSIDATGTPGSGNFLRGDGQWQAPGAASYTAPKVTKYTAAGTGTFSITGSPLYLRVRMVGGGGGGSGSGTASGGTGGNGTSSYFRVGASPDILIAGGGTGGAWTGGSGGAGGTATVTSPGVGSGFTGAGGGPTSVVLSSGAVTLAGSPGGAGIFGITPALSQANTAGANAVANTGGGGQGGGTQNSGATNYCGTGGGAGAFVDAIIPSPSSSYAYQVGAKGTGGTAGTNGRAGGDGADGYIEVTEFYQ